MVIQARLQSGMAALQELLDMLKKHNVLIDLKDALRKSVKAADSGPAEPSKAHRRRTRLQRHGGNHEKT